MPSRLTTKQFVQKAIEVHGSRYSYGKVAYSNSHDEVVIECPIHGPFSQTPNNHLNGNGCPKCKWDKIHGGLRDTTDSFILKARKVHGDLYDYSATYYRNGKTKVSVICRKHGEFFQCPNNHLTGYGCLKCGYEKCNNIKWSKPEQEFMDYIHVDARIKAVGHYIVDGIKNNTIYEFLGDYWHGNPACYDSFDKNPSKNKTFGELLSETFGRFDALKNMGYEVKYIWESEWKSFKLGSKLVLHTH
jgi:hypothetical protein